MDELRGALTSYAIVGTGETEPATAVSLLVDHLGLNLPEPTYSKFYCPEEVGRRSALRKILDRLETPRYLGVYGATPVDDPVATLLGRRETGERVALIALLADDPPEAEILLIHQARDKGIQVLDLANALDDLLLPGEEEATGDPGSSEAEAPEDESAPQEDTYPGHAATLVNLVRLMVREEIAAFFDVPPAPGNQVAPAADSQVPPAASGRARARKMADELGTALVEAAQEVSDIKAEEGDTSEPTLNGTPRPAAPKFRAEPGTRAGDGDTVAYYRNSAGEYRLAQSETGRTLRIKPDEHRVELTLAEQDSYVKAGKIKDPKDSRK